MQKCPHLAPQHLTDTTRGLEIKGGDCDTLWGARGSTAPGGLEGGSQRLRFQHKDHCKPEPGQTG